MKIPWYDDEKISFVTIEDIVLTIKHVISSKKKR